MRETTTEFGTVDGAGFYGKDDDTPGFTLNGKVYASGRVLSRFAGSILGKPAVVEVSDGWAVALRPVTVAEGEGVADVPAGVVRLRAAAEAVAALIAAAPRLSVRIEPSKDAGRVEFHVWNDATGQQMPDDAPETHGVLMWLAYTCESLFSAWVGEQDKTMRGETW